jgi:hypothetical protein
VAEGDGYSGAGHLPNLRPERRAAHPSTLPRQRRGTTPQMVGRYPDYDVMEWKDTWDPVTRRVVEQRLAPHGPLRFFQPEELETVRAFCNTVLAQEHEPRVPVVEMIDAKMADRQFDGYRYEDMPDDDEVWHRAMRGIDEVARRRYGRRFAYCADAEREAICDQFSKGVLQGGAFESLNCKETWSVLTRHLVSTFYSHPWAWNEIGFGGPAYPRGYMRLGENMREPRETPEAVHDDPEREEAMPSS